MIIPTVAELDALATGTIIYDRDHEMYQKREDGRWNYPAKKPTLQTLHPNSIMRYGPIQTLEQAPPEPVALANGETDLENLPTGSVVLGRYLALRTGDFWLIAGKHREWSTKYLARSERFPLEILKVGP